MKLSDIFESIAYKTLARVDIPGLGSNQHEINGVSALREFFNVDSKIEEPVSWTYYSDSDEKLSDDGSLTFYDARANYPSRTEWRLYYSGDFLSVAEQGDLFILVRRKSDQRLLGLIFKRDSIICRTAKTLFGIDDEFQSNQLINISHRDLEGWELDLVDRLILEDAGIESLTGEFTPSEEELVLKEFGTELPETRVFSMFARDHCEVNSSNPDEALIRWIDKETAFFDIILRHQIENRIHQGFDSADDFIDYAVSLTNTRKSRMGFSFEHHLEALFVVNNVLYDRGKITEGKYKPDFIFPGISYYHRDNFPVIYLNMLGAKSTCKDRWRQVLKEAEKIANKHLCTLERGISIDQTQQMRDENLTLVVPSPFHRTYTLAQRDEILSLNDFIEHVKETQVKAAGLL